MNQQMRIRLSTVLAGLLLTVFIASAIGAEDQPQASPEVTAAMQPYWTATTRGVIAIVADKTGRIHYRNLLGYCERRGQETHQRR